MHRPPADRRPPGACWGAGRLTAGAAAPRSSRGGWVGPRTHPRSGDGRHHHGRAGRYRRARTVSRARRRVRHVGSIRRRCQAPVPAGGRRHVPAPPAWGRPVVGTLGQPRPPGHAAPPPGAGLLIGAAGLLLFVLSRPSGPHSARGRASPSTSCAASSSTRLAGPAVVQAYVATLLVRPGVGAVAWPSRPSSCRRAGRPAGRVGPAARRRRAGVLASTGRSRVAPRLCGRRSRSPRWRYTSGRRTTTSARSCPHDGPPCGPGPWACCWWRWAAPSAPATACRLGSEQRASPGRLSAGLNASTGRATLRAGVAARMSVRRCAPRRRCRPCVPAAGEPVDVGLKATNSSPCSSTPP